MALSDMIELYQELQNLLKEKNKLLNKQTDKKILKHNNNILKRGFKTEKKIFFYLCYSNTKNILSNEIIEILINSLELKKNNLQELNNEFEKNKMKYEELLQKKKNSKSNVLIQEL